MHLASNVGLDSIGVKMAKLEDQRKTDQKKLRVRLTVDMQIKDLHLKSHRLIVVHQALDILPSSVHP